MILLRAILTALILGLSAVGTPVHAQEPSQNLAIFGSLRGSWEGHFEDASRGGLVLSMTCEPVLDGKAIRIRSISGRMVRETHYYWNPEKGQIEYLVLTNNGYVGLGSVALGADLIVETGDQITPAGTTNRTKGTWEVDPEGRLIARGYTLKEGGWQAGHVIVFEKKPGQGR